MRLKLGAQVVALGIVLGLLGLLVWKLVNQDQKQARKNAPAPAFSLPRLDRSGDLSLASLKGKAVGAELLGVLVRPVSRRGTRAPEGLAQAPRRASS